MSDKMQTWREQHAATELGGAATINQAIADLRKLADDLEHYRDAYLRAMSRQDYDAAKDHLKATRRVLAELVQPNDSRLVLASGEVETTRYLRQEGLVAQA